MIQFKLIKDGSSVRKHDINVLKSTINDLTEDEDSYIILEPKYPIENSIYLQAIMQNNEYYAEIRFVFGADDDFKHYSRTFQTVEDIVKVFSDYYNGKVPNVKLWSDDSVINVEEVDLKMTKLYKFEDDQIFYFEGWINDDKSLTIHKGMLGNTGETDNFETQNKDLPADVLLSKIMSEQKAKGYNELEDLTELIVQYTYDKSIKDNDLVETRDYIEAQLNNSLGWTGNGHCDGGDIGNGTMNIFCYVIDANVATKTIIDMLEEEDLIDGLKIAYADENTEEYIGVYPPNSSFVI